jgi:hypothetical protein
MDTFFNILKKSLVASMFVIFTMAATYVPQPSTPLAYAGAAAGGSTVWQQLYDNIQQIYTYIEQTATAISSAVSEYIDALEWNVEWILDGLAWNIAKSIIQAMTQDLIAWVNSGFEGSPMFVTDFGGFIGDVADAEFGSYIASLGDIGSFICSPFQLDIQVAVALSYQVAREDGSDPEACNLSDIKSNLENFISGTQNSFSEGGWSDWFEVTSKPEVYTPFGAAVAVEASMNARIINKKGEEINLISEGFMSQKECNDVEGEPEPVCTVTTPGNVISDALSRNVDGDRETLLEADKANEIFAAIVGQLGQSIFSEASSLISGF